MRKIGIIGGGVCGLVSAYFLKKNHPDYDICILEMGKECLKRIKVSGNGRCNLSNANINLSAYKNGSQIELILTSYSLVEQKFWDEIGLKMVLDEESRYYPYSDSAKTVHHILLTSVLNLGVKICYETQVKNLIQEGLLWRVLCNTAELVFDTLILATGGLSYQYAQTNYDYLKNLKLEFAFPKPSLCPIKTKEHFPKYLVGKRAKAKVTLYMNSTLLHEENGEILFKKDGISGIVIFNMSSFVARQDLKRKSYTFEIDFVKDVTTDTLIIEENKWGREETYRRYVNEELAQYLTENNIPPHIGLKRFLLHYDDLYGFTNSQVTSGGISLNMIDLNTLQLKKYPNIYVGGELIDVDGICGGYNLFFACACGYYIAKKIGE